MIQYCQKMLTVITAAALLFLNSEIACAAAKTLNIQHWKTSKGTNVYFVQTPLLPIISIAVGFDAGSARDGNHPGLAVLTNTLLNQGNTGLNVTQMAEGFESIGADYSHSVDQDMAVVKLKTLTDKTKLDRALNYFTKIFQPDFNQAVFEREKQLQQQAILQNQESPDAVAQENFLAAIYPNHPYGKPLLGTAESVKHITPAEVSRFYKTYYTARNAVIAMAGAVDTETAKKIAERLTAPLPEGNPIPALPEAKASKAAEKHIPYTAAQTAIRLGQVGISRHDPDYFSLQTGNYTLGGGMLVSRLGDEVREKRGLSYHVYSYFDPMTAKGPFVIMLATRKQQAKEALQVTQKTLEQFLSQGPTSEELASAKKFIIGNFPLRFESNEAITSALLNLGFYHLPLDYFDTYRDKINAVTTEQIKQAFNKHIKGNQLVVVTVGEMQ